MRASRSAGERRRLAPLSLLGLSLSALIMVSCGASPPTPVAVATESLTVVGPEEALPLVRELATTFAHGRPLTVTVESASAAAGMAALAAGTADIAVVSTPPENARQIWLSTEIARLPIAVLIQADNPVRNLTLDALGNIYTGRTTDWTSVGGPGVPIMVLSREPLSPVRARLDAALIAVDSRLTPNALLLPSDAAVAVTVARRPEGIGYVTGVQSAGGTKVVSIDGQQPGDLAHGRYYPLWLPIIMVADAQSRTTVGAFISFVNGRQGQRIITEWGCGPGGGKQ